VGILRDRRGVTAIEYGIMICMMTLVIVGAISTMGSQTLTQLFQKVANSL
jgi:Flp pilus assembly pilin Flp